MNRPDPWDVAYRAVQILIVIAVAVWVIKAVAG